MLLKSYFSTAIGQVRLSPVFLSPLLIIYSEKAVQKETKIVVVNPIEAYRLVTSLPGQPPIPVTTSSALDTGRKKERKLFITLFHA